MNKLKSPLISVCVPAYNRSEYLADLIDSIISQSFNDYEIVICEDFSPERAEIERIASEYSSDRLRIILNEKNLGYDGNIRKLALVARGMYCFYMGNDDLMMPDALNVVASIVKNHSDVSYILRNYAWFSNDKTIVDQEVRYFYKDVILEGREAIKIGFRRAGVISGFIVKRDVAMLCATERYDGTLYYQMHLAINALKCGKLYCTSKILTLSRSTTPPDFGNSQAERFKFTPGSYTPSARIAMINGAISILKDQADRNTTNAVMNDYSRHIYPYIKDQLSLNFLDYIKFIFSIGRIGFYKYPSFYIQVIGAYMLGEKFCDSIIKSVRKLKTILFA